MDFESWQCQIVVNLLTGSVIRSGITFSCVIIIREVETKQNVYVDSSRK